MTFSGKATTPNAYANFYNNLNSSPFFRDVGKISYVANRDDVTFSLSASFVPTGQNLPPAQGQQGSRGENEQIMINKLPFLGQLGVFAGLGIAVVLGAQFFWPNFER